MSIVLVLIVILASLLLLVISAVKWGTPRMFNVCYKKNGFPNKEKGTYKSNNNRKICTHCRMSGYTIENCYKKHGYPPGYKSFNGKPTQVHSIVATNTVFFF